MAIGLSKRQVGDADRVGGIELAILYPADLGPEPDGLGDDCDREATAVERAWAEDALRANCAEHALVSVHTRVARIHRPGVGYCAQIAVTLIGRRWVHASTHKAPRVAFARAP